MLRHFYYKTLAKVTYWLEASVFLWSHRRNVVNTLLAAEYLADALGRADRADIQDIHSLDNNIYHAIAKVAFSVRPPEHIVNKAVKSNAHAD